VHHRIDDSPDDLDMDLDSRFRPNQGQGGRIILLGDGTELTTETPDAEMFDNDNEDKDLDSQVDKFNTEGSNGTTNAREETPGPQTKQLHAVADSPSSVKTEKSEGAEAPPAAGKDTTLPDKVTAGTKSQK
jgi:protein phosphatase 2C family protein 2/3